MVTLISLHHFEGRGMSRSPLTQPAPVHSSLTRTQTPGRNLQEQQPPFLPPRLSFVTVLPRKKLREHSRIFFFSFKASILQWHLFRVVLCQRQACLSAVKPLKRQPDQSVKLAVLAVGIFFYYIKLHGMVSSQILAIYDIVLFILKNIYIYI